MSKFRGAGKWRAEGPERSNTATSIRGKSISQPIPFPDPDDDEFPIRTPGSGIALPLSADGIERLRVSTPNSENDNTSHQTGIAVSDYITGTRTPSMPTEPPPLPEARVRSIPSHRPNQPSGLRNSITSVPTSVPDAPSIAQRKKSSLRSVFGKLFGKKKKGNSSSSSKRASAFSNVRAGQHRSDPSALNRITKGTMNSQQRSASLPINEFNRALRSHSIVATDFQNIGNDSANDPNRESLQGDKQSRPRRATTPSRLWTPNKIPGYVDWTGLSPRPASSHARGSKAISDAEANSVIGTAVTGSNHPKRRSRSVGELQEAMRAHVITRGRTDEIRYWRESYDPGLLPPMCSNMAETEVPLPVRPEYSRDEPPKPEPFDFGPMGEMAGMKITQAASLETRVQRLEGRMDKVERTVARLRHDGPIHLQDPPKSNSVSFRSSSGTRPATRQSEVSLPKHPRYRDAQARGDFLGSRQGSQKRSSSYGSGRPSTMSTNISQLQSFDLFPPGDLLSTEVPGSAQATARPLSTSTTIRGIPSSSPTLPVDGTLNGAHFKALTDMIHAEQSARLHLESVVHNLQRQLQTVLVAARNTYPTPDSDAPHEGGPEGHNFSNFEQDDFSDDEGRYVNDEVFRTPNESRNHFEDEIFGDMSGNTTEGKSAPRTLSLSQITLGMNVQPSLNF